MKFNVKRMMAVNIGFVSNSCKSQFISHGSLFRDCRSNPKPEVKLTLIMAGVEGATALAEICCCLEE